MRFVAGGGVGVGWLCVTSFLISRLLAFSSVRAGPFLDASTRGGPGECRAVVHSPTSGSGSVPMHGTSMCHILDTLLHAGNCMADKSESGGGSDDPAFPCEDPTQPELEEWLKCMKDRLIDFDPRLVADAAECLSLGQQTRRARPKSFLRRPPRARRRPSEP